MIVRFTKWVACYLSCSDYDRWIHFRLIQTVSVKTKLVLFWFVFYYPGEKRNLSELFSRHSKIFCHWLKNWSEYKMVSWACEATISDDYPDIIDPFLFIENYSSYLSCPKHLNINSATPSFRCICCFFNKWDVHNFITELSVFDNSPGIICFWSRSVDTCTNTELYVPWPYKD